MKLAAFLAVIFLLFVPMVLRLIAALLLVQAGAVEEFFDYWRRHLAGSLRSCGVPMRSDLAEVEE
jgi:hypothetical protein